MEMKMRKMKEEVVLGGGEMEQMDILRNKNIGARRNAGEGGESGTVQGEVKHLPVQQI